MTGNTTSALSELELRPKYKQSRAELEHMRKQIIEMKQLLKSKINQLSAAELQRRLVARKNLNVDYPVLVGKVRQLKPQYIAMQQRHQELCQLICQSVGKHTLNDWRREVRGEQPRPKRLDVLPPPEPVRTPSQALATATT